MTEKEINIYLEAFWKGESTQEQEEALKKFFAGRDIPQSFDQDRPYFNYLLQEQRREIQNPNFDQEVIQQIKTKKIQMFWYGALKIAASIAVLGAAGWWYHTHQVEMPVADLPNISKYKKSIPEIHHPSDSQHSYQLAKDALMLMSKGINQDSTHTKDLQEFNQQLKNFRKNVPSTEILP